ncbi:uncharacterized protein LOC115734823 [Rhodamnia argentea]|uniref:Uncharacterized protein LOC115734823 n=1 Tax=Rhodamnia argentea TaxID=178133 RepID=A0A8B8NHV3_9MYRT|nr:uncharacterized protein LOC115734823 [Rhodamnia argentea]
MEEKEDKKRARDDSAVDSPESNLTRVDSAGSDLGSPESKRARAVPDPNLDSANSDLCSPEAKRIQYDLLDILDDPEGVTDRDPAIQGLDSVIRSFEEEILVPPAPSALDLSFEAAETRSELGYLLEASDDELGLPPSFVSSAEDDGKVADGELPTPAGLGFGETMAFENDMSGYDSFEFVPEATSNGNNSHATGNEFVTLGGLFDFPEGSCEPDEGPEMLWRPESLPAI